MSDRCETCAEHNLRANKAEGRLANAEETVGRLVAAFRINMIRCGESDEEIERVLEWCATPPGTPPG